MRNPYLEPANSIINKLGGLQATADAADVSLTRVCRWRLPKESHGGTDGLVPARHQQKLLDWAAKNGIKLAPKDFFVKARVARRQEMRAVG